MAEKILESLVLRGVRVANDVRMVLERVGSNLIAVEPQAVSLSFARHLFPGDPQSDAEAGTRWLTACSTGGNKTTAHRAGRLGSPAGVLGSSLARTARPTVHSGRLLVQVPAPALRPWHGPTGSPVGMPRPAMRGSLICSPCQSEVKQGAPPVRPQQQPYHGNFTTY
jgi:hypothetical protein